MRAMRRTTVQLLCTALILAVGICSSSTTAFAPALTTATRQGYANDEVVAGKHSFGVTGAQRSTSLQAAMLSEEGERYSRDLSATPQDALKQRCSLPLANTETQSQSQQTKGLMTIIGITFLFASNSPILHTVFASEAAPPVLLVNAAVSSIALLGLFLGGGLLEGRSKDTNGYQATPSLRFQAGLELGFWKFLGTSANLAGLALTTANHGAFLIQLTTLIVPVVQGLMGVPLSKRTQFSVLLALAGVVMFTQDCGGCDALMLEQASTMLQGDALCVAAAGFYAAYDLRLFEYGKKVAPRELITGKIATQSVLSLLLLAVCGSQQTTEYVTNHMHSLQDLDTMIPVMLCILWSGLAVNAVAPFLQVEGQQIVGPTRCQTIYASQPLWAAGMSFAFLGETVGVQGLTGGMAFLAALFLAATAPSSSESVFKTTPQDSTIKRASSLWLDFLHWMPPSRFAAASWK